MPSPHPHDWGKNVYLASLREPKPFPKVDFFTKLAESTYGKHAFEESPATKFLGEAVAKIVEGQINAIANALEICAQAGIGLDVVHHDTEYRGFKDLMLSDDYKIEAHTYLEFRPARDLKPGEIRHIYKPYNETPTN